MKKVTAFLMMTGFLGVASVASAQNQQQAPKASGAAYVFISPSLTSLDAQGITAPLKPATGLSTYENDGNYLGGAVYVHFRNKWGVDGAIFTGTSQTLDPQVSNGYKGMNPLTAEHVVLFDTSASYTVCAGAKCGIVDALVGVLDLTANPGALSVPTNPAVGNFNPFVIDNPSSHYFGLALGAKGYYPFHPRVGVDYKLQYLPTYAVKGHYADAGDNTLSPEDVVRYRFGVNYFLNRRFGLTLGFQGIQLDATLKQGPYQGSKAVVKNHGYYFGGSTSF